MPRLALTLLALLLSAAPMPMEFPAPAPPPMTRETRAVLPGDPLETALTVLTAAADGPAVFVVGGVHGDEIAGWMAADRLAAETRLTAGTLYILSPANRPGAEANARWVEAYQDLNRSFPGDPLGGAAERLAAAVYAEIEAARPAVLLDLHEASVRQSNRDFLGSSIIFTSLDGMEELVFELLAATREGRLCSGPFGYFGPGPAGSVNRAVTEGLSVPALTVETFRGDPLERRVGDHLDIARFVLSYYRMEE